VIAAHRTSPRYREKAWKVVIMPGPAPKPPTKRRNRGIPKSYGAAVPTVAPAAGVRDRELGFDAHPLIVDLWTALQTSCESRFFSAADWERARLECWHADTVMKRPTGAGWEMVQHGLRDLLISPAEKRRCGIELKPPDPGEDAAVLTMLDGYRESLKP
jgi:hypothetical protein